MTIQHKTRCLVATAICLATLSLPSYAWQAARGAGGGAAVRGSNGAAVRGPNGNVAARSYHGGGAYRAPVAYGYRGGAYYDDNHYSGGQVAGAAVAGAVVGAAIANRNQPPPPPTTVIIQQPY